MMHKLPVDLQNKFDKIKSLNKRGFLILTFYDNSKIKVRIKNFSSEINSEGLFICKLKTYTDDKNDLTVYDFYEIKEVE